MTTNTLETQIRELKNDQIMVIPAEAKPQRVCLHRYIESLGIDIYKISFKLLSYDSYIKVRIGDCYECYKQSVWYNKYHYGDLPSNVDQYYTGFCKNCGNHQSVDITFSCFDEFKYIEHNNVIVVGNYFKTYQDSQKKYSTFESEYDSHDRDSFIKRAEQLFKVIPVPTKLLNKRNLRIYMDKMISELDLPTKLILPARRAVQN